MKRPIVIDTDTGSDDAVALVLALRRYAPFLIRPPRRKKAAA